MPKTFVKTPEHQVFSDMRRRCNNPKCNNYPRYGGRGIKVCERWSQFSMFLYDMGRRPSNMHSLDRIDNSGDYEPENCRWVLRKEQQNNTRRNLYFTYNGETLTLAQWSERVDIPYATLRCRLKNYGWDFVRAITTPVMTRQECGKERLRPK